MGILIFPGAIFGYMIIISLWDWWHINYNLPCHQRYNVPLVIAGINLCGLLIIVVGFIAWRMQP